MDDVSVLSSNGVSDLYDSEFKIAYNKLLQITTEVAEAVAKNIYEECTHKAYNAILDTQADRAHIIATKIAEEVADSYAELEAFSKSYGLKD